MFLEFLASGCLFYAYSKRLSERAALLRQHNMRFSLVMVIDMYNDLTESAFILFHLVDELSTV